MGLMLGRLLIWAHAYPATLMIIWIRLQVIPTTRSLNRGGCSPRMLGPSPVDMTLQDGAGLRTMARTETSILPDSMPEGEAWLLSRWYKYCCP